LKYLSINNIKFCCWLLLQSSRFSWIQC